MNIILAEGRSRVRFALKVLLSQQPAMNIVDEAWNAQELLQAIRRTSPDLLLLDWNLPGMPFGELVQALKQMNPRLRVVVLSEKMELRTEALAAGADAFASKTHSPEQLLAVIQSFSPGASYSYHP